MAPHPEKSLIPMGFRIRPDLGVRRVAALFRPLDDDMFRSFELVGRPLGLALMVAGVLALWHGWTIAAIWQGSAGAFLAACSTPRAGQPGTGDQDTPVKALMTRDPLTTPADITLDELAKTVMLRHDVSFLPVVEDGVLLGYIDTDILARIDFEHWPQTRVADVFVGLAPDLIIDDDSAVSALIERMARTGRRKFLVTREDTLLGVISLSDLTGFLVSGDKPGSDTGPTT